MHTNRIKKPPQPTRMLYCLCWQLAVHTTWYKPLLCMLSTSSYMVSVTSCTAGLSTRLTGSDSELASLKQMLAQQQEALTQAQVRRSAGVEW
jgi:hypothetical protein